MEVVKTYSDQLGREILSSNIHEFDFYVETIVSEANQKTSNTFKDGKLIDICYHISSYNEVSELLKLNPYASFEIEYSVNSYKVLDSLSYSDYLLSFKKKFVFDKCDNLVCLVPYDVITDTPEWVEKYYYDDNDEGVYTFLYNKDGSCSYIDCDQLMHDSEIWAHDIGVRSDIKFTWEGFEYYKNAEPLGPLD